MRSTGNVPATSPSSRGNSSHHNNNSSSGNSGSQYALCALGVGLVALGVVMVVWSVVPADHAGNSSSSSSGGKPDDRSKASSVAFVLVGGGVTMLLLSLCVGMRNKQREQQRGQEAQNHTGVEGGAANAGEDDGETAEERAQRYNVPSYEEAVGSGQYPVRQSNLRQSTTQLPSYDDLVQVDSVQVEVEGTASEVPPAAATLTSAGSAAATPTTTTLASRRPGKASRKLLPLKIRRIKSEKLHMRNADNSQPPGGVSIEPLTPPPLYEDKVPQLRD